MRALALLLAVLLAGAFAAPSASAAGLRAAKCCAERCEKPRSADAARECCPTLGADRDVGSFTVSAKAASPETSALAVTAPVIELSSPAWSPLPSPAAPSRAAPLFLRTLSLRL